MNHEQCVYSSQTAAGKYGTHLICDNALGIPPTANNDAALYHNDEALPCGVSVSDFVLPDGMALASASRVRYTHTQVYDITRVPEMARCHGATPQNLSLVAPSIVT